jgi:hypothetical protein
MTHLVQLQQHFRTTSTVTKRFTARGVAGRESRLRFESLGPHSRPGRLVAQAQRFVFDGSFAHSTLLRYLLLIAHSVPWCRLDNLKLGAFFRLYLPAVPDKRRTSYPVSGTGVELTRVP